MKKKNWTEHEIEKRRAELATLQAERPANPEPDEIHWFEFQRDIICDEIADLQAQLEALRMDNDDEAPYYSGDADDREWRKEIAREEGMLQCVHAYNDIMGY